MAGLVVILLTAVNPVGTAIGFVLATIAMTLVLLAYLWLDRWEPEPPRLLVLAFLWGASVAVRWCRWCSNSSSSRCSTRQPRSTVRVRRTLAIGAPIIEEAAKGVFLLIMMTGGVATS